MLHEREVHNTIQCESWRVNSLILLEELDVQLQKKIKKTKGKDSPSGGEKKQNYGLCSEAHIFHDYLEEKFQSHTVEQSTRKTQRKNNSISSCRQRRGFDTHNFMLPRPSRKLMGKDTAWFWPELEDTHPSRTTVLLLPLTKWPLLRWLIS